MKRTKIICTLGPGTDKPGILEKMLEAVMNVGRCNFSHGTHEAQLEIMNMLLDAAKRVNKTVALLLDTKGPEMRLGKFKDGKVRLTEGEQFIITTKELEGTKEIAMVNHKLLAQEVVPGNKILLSDGLISLNVERVEGDDIITTVLNSGDISTGKRVAVPGVAVNLPFLSEQDKNDIVFGIKNNMDFIAASFVQRAADILAIRELLNQHNYTMDIIAKIENEEGVKNIDEILEVADGIMVARGDLGVEIPTQEVPVVQKMIIEKCNKIGKPVITATQMLESMVTNPRPTRAEASDVANAIMDGTDAIMLSGETASGEYPVESVQMMATIAERMEQELKYTEILKAKGLEIGNNVTDAISHATVQVAHETKSKAILTASETGFAARMISKYRPSKPIIAVTPSEKVMRKMQLYWGVQGILGESFENSDNMAKKVAETALKSGLVQKGDMVIITAGVPVGKAGSTNMLRINILGEDIAQ